VNVQCELDTAARSDLKKCERAAAEVFGLSRLAGARRSRRLKDKPVAEIVPNTQPRVHLLGAVDLDRIAMKGTAVRVNKAVAVSGANHHRRHRTN